MLPEMAPPWLDATVEVVAEERRAREHPGEALAEVGKESQARHGIRRKIQDMEAVGVHDVVEEVRERGQSPQEKKLTKKGYRFWPSLAKSAGTTHVAGCPVVFLPHRGKK